MAGNSAGFLKPGDDFAIPGLVIDFKNFYTILTENLYKYKKNRIATMSELFREELSQRFASFLSRIGLPVLESEVPPNPVVAT